jgi:hypothetical protein
MLGLVGWFISGSTCPGSNPVGCTSAGVGAGRPSLHTRVEMNLVPNVQVTQGLTSL